MSKARGLADLGNVYNDGALSNRNLIINGAMNVSQRGTSATSAGIGTENYLSVDRWAINSDGSGSQLSVDVSTDAPDGFSKSLYISPDASVPTLTGAHRIILKHKIEGQNLTQWSYATAGCKPLTLSFWVKSNVTGNVGIILAATEICGQTYSINTSGVWEYKTITLPASVVGSLISYDNTTGLSLDMWLAAGPVFQGTYAGDGVWTANAVGSYTQASNINLYSSTSNYFQITGVQLEVGDTATPFEHRSHDQEHTLCQRYFQRFGGGGTAERMGVGGWNNSTSADMLVCLAHEMRVSPTVTSPYTGRVLDLAVAWHDVSSFVTTESTTKHVNIGAQISGTSGAAQGDVAILGAGGAILDYLFDAEL